jgi:hypothetical protein
VSNGQVKVGLTISKGAKMKKYTPQQAQQRVMNSEVLRPHYSIICEYDWNEGQSHIDWVCTAPESEIVSWAEGIAADDERQV